MNLTAKPSKAESGLNRLEAAYLETLRVDEDHDSIGIQNITLRLANNCRYTPDFNTVCGGRLVFHEVKGFFRDDAKVKLKVAAATYPRFDFLLITRRTKKEGGGWRVERIEP